MIGDRIKELRKKNRYTQKEIGEMCGVSDISVYKWETDRTEPNIDTLCKLADIFGVSLDYLAGSVDKSYQNTALDNEIMQLVQKMDVDSKEKLISTIRIWFSENK